MGLRIAVVAFWSIVAAAVALIWAVHWTSAGATLEWLGGQNGAAWAQAVGTVVGVWAAVAVASQQAAAQRQRELDQRIERYRALGVASSMVATPANNLLAAARLLHQPTAQAWRDAMARDREIRQNRRRIEDACAILRGFDISIAETAHLGALQTAARNMATELDEELDEFIDNPHAAALDALFLRVGALFDFAGTVSNNARNLVHQ